MANTTSRYEISICISTSKFDFSYFNPKSNELKRIRLQNYFSWRQSSLASRRSRCMNLLQSQQIDWPTYGSIDPDQVYKKEFFFSLFRNKLNSTQSDFRTILNLFSTTLKVKLYFCFRQFSSLWFGENLWNSFNNFGEDFRTFLYYYNFIMVSFIYICLFSATMYE